MYRIYTLNEQNDIFFRYKNKQKIGGKKCIHKSTQIDAMALTETASPFLEENQPKKQFGSNSLSLLHPLEGTTFVVSLISVLAVELHNTFLQMSQLNSVELTQADTFLIFWISTILFTLNTTSSNLGS